MIENVSINFDFNESNIPPDFPLDELLEIKNLPLPLNLFNIIYPLIFLVVGLPGNCTSMVIWLRRMRACKNSTCLFLGCLCIVDTYVLVHGCLRNWFRTLVPYLSTTQSDVSNATDTFLGIQQLDLRVWLGCSVPLFAFSFMSDLSVWLIVVLCIERFICTWIPMAGKKYCTSTNAAIIISGCAITLAGLNSHFFTSVEPVYPKNPQVRVYCHFVTENSLLLKYWHLIDFCVYSFIPLALIFLANSLMLYRLKHSGLFARLRASRIRKLILVMSVSHFVFTMPIVVYFLIESYFECSMNYACSSFQDVFIMLQLANHLTHIFIYSGNSSLFLQDLRVCFFPLKRSWYRCLGREFSEPHSFSMGDQHQVLVTRDAVNIPLINLQNLEKDSKNPSEMHSFPNSLSQRVFNSTDI